MHTLTLVFSAIKRPRMYTVNGTCGEVIAFLEGYFSAVAKAAPENEDVLNWFDFKRWLRKSLDSEATEVFRKIADSHFGEDALSTFENLFLSWQQENAGKQGQLNEILRKL